MAFWKRVVVVRAAGKISSLGLSDGQLKWSWTALRDYYARVKIFRIRRLREVNGER